MGNISMTMIAGGIPTILQALNRGSVGSGYLCTEGADPSCLCISVLAACLGPAIDCPEERPDR